jgi:hypothetical protein
LLLSDTEQDIGESKENTVSQGIISQVVAARLTASMELLSEGFSTWEVYIKSSEVLRTLFMYAGGSQASSLQINRTARTAIFHIANSHMPLVIGTLTYDMMNAQKMEDRLACMKVINMFARKVNYILIEKKRNDSTCFNISLTLLFNLLETTATIFKYTTCGGSCCEDTRP